MCLDVHNYFCHRNCVSFVVLNKYLTCKNFLYLQYKNHNSKLEPVVQRDMQVIDYMNLVSCAQDLLPIILPHFF